MLDNNLEWKDLRWTYENCNYREVVYRDDKQLPSICGTMINGISGPLSNPKLKRDVTRIWHYSPKDDKKDTDKLYHFNVRVNGKVELMWHVYDDGKSCMMIFDKNKGIPKVENAKQGFVRLIVVPTQ